MAIKAQKIAEEISLSLAGNVMQIGEGLNTIILTTDADSVSTWKSRFILLADGQKFRVEVERL